MLQAGVVDTDNLERRKRKNAWAGRYDERNLESAHIGQALEEGEEGDNYIPTSEAERERLERRRHEGLWGDHDEEFYNDGAYLSAFASGQTYVDLQTEISAHPTNAIGTTPPTLKAQTPPGKA